MFAVYFNFSQRLKIIEKCANVIFCVLLNALKRFFDFVFTHYFFLIANPYILSKCFSFNFKHENKMDKVKIFTK